MSARIIDGKAIAADMREEIKKQAGELASRGMAPGLGVVLVGDDPASQSYVAGKERACKENGIFSDDHRLPASTSAHELLSLVRQLNNDDRIHGILVQLPLPDHIDSREIIEAIDPRKDVDGFHPVSVGNMVIGRDAFFPCTPHGVLHLLKRSEVKTEGAHAVIVGRSSLVGKPLANLLMRKEDGANATVTVCHSRTPDIGEHTRRADILVSAIGRPGTITADMVREGAVVVDVGVNRVPDASRKRGYRLVGDVDFEPVSHKASLITPVPGGVGPMTITMLLHNTVQSARRFLEG